MTDGEKLHMERRRRKLVAWRLAALSDIDPTTLSKIERDERQPTFEQKIPLARALGMEPEQLFAEVKP